MTNPHANRIAQLEQMRLDRFRSLRWAVIDAARKDGMTWDEIAAALDMQRPSVMRTYRDHAPSPSADD